MYLVLCNVLLRFSSHFIFFWFLYYRNNDWSTCPSGYYLSGFYRSDGNKLYNITHAWCCKPDGAPDSYKTCYDEDVSFTFDWNQMEMVSCDRSGYYITGLYKSDCNNLHCIEKFKCCDLQVAGWDNSKFLMFFIIKIWCSFSGMLVQLHLRFIYLISIWILLYRVSQKKYRCGYFFLTYTYMPRITWHQIKLYCNILKFKFALPR